MRATAGAFLLSTLCASGRADAAASGSVDNSSTQTLWQSRSLVLDEGAGLGEYHASLVECGNLCEETQGCNSFAYAEPNCYLKDKVISLDDDAAMPVYETYYRSQDEVWTSRSLVLREGASLGDHRASLAECEKLCEDSQGCNSFAYSRPYGGGARQCHLKDKVISPDDEAAKTAPSAGYETYYQSLVPAPYMEPMGESHFCWNEYRCCGRGSVACQLTCPTDYDLRCEQHAGTQCPHTWKQSLEQAVGPWCCQCVHREAEWLDRPCNPTCPCWNKLANASSVNGDTCGKRIRRWNFGIRFPSKVPEAEQARQLYPDVCAC